MSKEDNAIGFTLGVVGGIAGGILLSVLLAPKSGEETRSEVREKLKQLKEKYTPEVESARDKAFSSLENLKCRLEIQCARINESLRAQKLARAKKRETEIYGLN